MVINRLKSLFPMRRQTDHKRDGNATSCQQTKSVAWIGRVDVCLYRRGEAGRSSLVEEVVEAKTQLALIKERSFAHREVEEQIRQIEGFNGSVLIQCDATELGSIDNQ